VDAFIGRSDSKATLIDSKGRHCTGCSTGGGTHDRHNLVRNAIFSIAKETGLSVRLEALHLIADSGNRPADIFFPTWMSTTQPAALDVSIVVPKPTNYADDNFTLALDAAYTAKCVKHSGLNFIPLIFTTAGSVHIKSLKALHFYRRRPFTKTKQHGRADLMKKICIAIHTGNSRCMLNHGFFS
jgi:hypothetical protein